MSWVWATAERADQTTLHADLPPQTVAYVDGGSGERLWGRVYPAGPRADERAAAEFAATAAAAAELAAAAPAGAVAVLGDGMLAGLVRSALPRQALASPDTAGAASVIVDTTGSAGELGRAVAALPRLGLLVLAAPPDADEIDLATYKDIHVRGLTLVGVPWADGGRGALAETALAGIGRARLGRPAPESALYALTEESVA